MSGNPGDFESKTAHFSGTGTFQLNDSGIGNIVSIVREDGGNDVAFSLDGSTPDFDNRTHPRVPTETQNWFNPVEILDLSNFLIESDENNAEIFVVYEVFIG